MITTMDKLTIKREIEISLTQQDIMSLFVTCFEGGCNYWLLQADYAGPPDRVDAEANLVWWGHEGIYQPGLIILLRTEDYEPESEEESDQYDCCVIWDDIVHALRSMPIHNLQNIINEDYDAEDADVFLQYAVFGEMIYG